MKEKGWQGIASMLGKSGQKKRNTKSLSNQSRASTSVVRDSSDDESDGVAAEVVHVASTSVVRDSSDDESDEVLAEFIQGDTDSESPMAEGSDSDVPMSDDGDDGESVPTVTAVPLLDKTLPYPTDPAHFINKPMSPNLCSAILAEGPCQPGLNVEFKFVQDNKGRSFNRQWYKPKLKNGMQSYRDWLVYSPTTDCAYCFPCWLFADRGAAACQPNFCDPKMGFKRWRDATTKLAIHENSDIHKDAVKVMIETKLRLKLGKSVNQEQQRAREMQIIENRKILHRLLDATLYLSKQNLAFRGHAESIKRVRGLEKPQPEEHSCLGKPPQEGNFLELVKLLAKYDAPLAKHLATAPKNASYLSPQIQNEFIGAIANAIQERIIAEIKEAHYYGIIMDSTIDISHVDQLSFCIRYVDSQFKIQERFLLFNDIKKSDSESLFQYLKKILSELGLELSLVRSQSYDGAANMSGLISGLQTRVKEENKLAIYVHCCAHNLNLVLCDACSECNEAVTFFGTVQKIYNYFTQSQPRHNVLEDALKELNLPQKKLQKQGETRWYSRKEALTSVKETYPALLLALEKLSDTDRNVESRAEANALLGYISTIEFLVMLETWVEILTDIKSASEYLQKESMDLLTASSTIKSSTQKLQDNRTDTHFHEILEQASTIAEEEDIPQEFTKPRIRRRKKMPGELARDEPVVDPVQRFKVDVFFRIYDTLISELKERFSDFHTAVTNFACLMPKELGDMEGIRKLATMYDQDVEKDLVISEYKQFVHFYKESAVFQETKPKTVQDMLVAIKDHDLNNVYPNLTVLYLILGTIAVSSATSERSFSRLKLIKSYLRSTMTEERLSSLALISIERDFADTVDFDTVIDTFSAMSQRRFVLK